MKETKKQDPKSNVPSSAGERMRELQEKAPEVRQPGDPGEEAARDVQHIP